MFAFVILAALGLAACQAGTQPNSNANAAVQGTHLATQEDLAAIIDRPLSYDAGRTVVIRGDGTMEGDWDGVVLAGTYEMQDGYFCRTITAGPDGGLPTDCQLIVMRGDTLEFTRERGTGRSFSYKML
jgi:hypothetical protein